MDVVTVLLSTYNGEKYLPELLESVYAQTDVEVHLLVRDDGSTDQTIHLLQREQEKGRLQWYGGDNLGPARSFLALMDSAPQCEWYAFCDQDDVWLPHKLSRALRRLREADGAAPALYYGRPFLVDEKLSPLPPTSRALERMETFASSLVASNATGCTMVFNRRLLEAVNRRKPDYVFMHDDWVHKLCLMEKGRLFFDENVPLLYRQHGGNLIGTPSSEWMKLRRHLQSLTRRDCVRSRTAASLLQCCSDRMDPLDRRCAQMAADYKDSLRAILRLAFSRCVRTGYRERDLLFVLAVLMKAY